MPTYDDIVNFLKSQTKFNYRIRPQYVVILASRTHHITIIKDHWDDYESKLGLPYWMWHVSLNSDDNSKCSTYMWIRKSDLAIKRVSSKYFKYEQEEYGFTSSTRKPCDMQDIVRCLIVMKRIMKNIGIK